MAGWHAQVFFVNMSWRLPLSESGVDRVGGSACSRRREHGTRQIKHDQRRPPERGLAREVRAACLSPFRTVSVRLGGGAVKRAPGTSEDLRASPRFTAQATEERGLAREVRAACLSPFRAVSVRLGGGAAKRGQARRKTSEPVPVSRPRTKRPWRLSPCLRQPGMDWLQSLGVVERTNDGLIGPRFISHEPETRDRPTGRARAGP
jgi:hypothetical protein